MLKFGAIEMSKKEEEKVHVLIAKTKKKASIVSITRALPDEKGHLLVEIDGKVTEVKA